MLKMSSAWHCFCEQSRLYRSYRLLCKNL